MSRYTSRWTLLALFSVPLSMIAQPAADPAHATRVEQRQMRQSDFYHMRSYPGDTIPSGARAAAVAEMQRMEAREIRAGKTGRGASAQSWTLVGPRPINVNPEQTNSGPPFSAGRVTALAVDPRNADVVYMGAADGGIWKTTDAGQNWTPIGDNQPSMAIGSMALAPSNPNILYVGTGEQNNSGDSYYGAGVLRSTDGGATFTQMAGPFVGPFNSSRVSGGGARIGALAVHPADPNIVLAAVDRASTTASGIYRTTDGGTTWTNVLSGAVGTDVAFNPADGTIAYAAMGSSGGSARNGVYKSTDGGLTWTSSGGTAPQALPSVNVGRIALGLGTSNPNVLYAGIQNSSSSLFGTLLGLYKTTDGGQTWTRLPSPDYCTPQCSYDNVVRVHPNNSSIVVAAGLPPYRSLDGGFTWVNLAGGSNGAFAHTDHHALAFSADGTRLYVGNDGGVYLTNNATVAPGPWTDLNGTLAISEFSSNVSIHPSDPNIAFAGTQDNGTLAYTGGLIWDQAVGGDGGFTAMDFVEPSIRYGLFPGGQIYKLPGATGVNALPLFQDYSGIYTNGINPRDRVQFYAPLVMDPSNPVRLYFGTQFLYQTNDGAGLWTAISPDLAPTLFTITTIAVAPGSSKTVAVGTSNGKVQITNSADQGAAATFTDRSAGLPGRPVSSVVFDPVDPATVYALISGFSGFLANDNGGHVFKSTNSGATWTDISGNLPNIPVNDLVVDPDLANTLYLAADIGVFQSTDGGQSWATLSTGSPKVLVQSLNLHRASRTLRAVTYGRSMWDLSVPLSGASQAPRIVSLSPASVNAGAAPLTITVTGSNFSAGSVARWNGVDHATTFVSTSTVSFVLSVAEQAKIGRSTVAVFNPVAGGGLSNLVNLPIGPAPATGSDGIVSAASPGVRGPLVPGSVASLYGTNLAADLVVAAAAPLPFTLGGVTVVINGIPAPLFFVSKNQINFQVPWDLEGASLATVTVFNGLTPSVPIQVNVAISAPSLFSVDGSGTGQGAILIAGPEVVAAPAGAFPNSRPAARGEFLEIFATALGPVSRLQGDGLPKPTTTAPAISRSPAMTIGGIPTDVLFAGLTPGAVGLYQVNVQIPANAPVGNAVPVIATLSGVSSNTVMIAIGAN